jgi:hypothetical protein
VGGVRLRLPLGYSLFYLPFGNYLLESIGCQSLIAMWQLEILQRQSRLGKASEVIYRAVSYGYARGMAKVTQQPTRLGAPPVSRRRKLPPADGALRLKTESGKSSRALSPSLRKWDSRAVCAEQTPRTNGYPKAAVACGPFQLPEKNFRCRSSGAAFFICSRSLASNCSHS